ncbi:MAG TPA: sulfatase-like hydrolase/transferase [Novosphingobium sp.]|nr:sulfatase-like hydrolase/transferase [Novosphingobium sp.]
MERPAAARSDVLLDIPYRWILCWLLLPNLIVILMWPIVGVPMQAGIALSGALAFVVSQLPWRPVRALGVAAIIVMVSTLYVSHLFAIPPLNIELITQSVSDIRPLQSPEYAIAGALLLAIMGTAIHLAPRVRPFSGWMQPLYAALAVMLFINLDGALAFDGRQLHRSLPSAGTPIDSAVRHAQLSPAAKPRHNVLIIMVEALGMPSTPEERAIFASDWNRPEWSRRYDVRQGTTRYFGSTTNGELRELCDRWAHYSGFDFDHADCLPHRFQRAGYETTAMHSFGGQLFDRRNWYPKIGFENLAFSDELWREGAGRCPGVFPGACDADVPAIIGRKLAGARKPQFIYWLTLNTHVPVVEDDALGTNHCSVGPKEWRAEYPGLCRLFQLHHILADRISALAMSPELPPTDILIVGDHKPPLFDRASNGRFDPGHVPWVYLRARDITPSSTPPALAPPSR